MKILRHSETGELSAYPRTDDEPVIGLDPLYEVFDLIQEAQPEYDPATHQLAPTQAIDTQAKTVTRGWNVVEIEVVVSITALRHALIVAGLQDAVLAAIAGIEDATEKAKAQAWWETARTVRRNHALVVAIGAAIGQTVEQIDAIFATAQTIDAQL